MPRGHDICHVTLESRVARLPRMNQGPHTSAQSAERATLVQLGCVLMIAAAGLRAAITAVFELETMGLSQHWPMLWFSGYAVFVLAYCLRPGRRRSVAGARRCSWRKA